MNYRRSINFFLFVLIFMESIFGIFTSRAQQVEALSQSKNVLPRLYISLSNVTLDEINSGSKKTKYPGNIASFYVDGDYYTFPNVEIRGRGNSTWKTEGDKKPYQIRFDSKTNLFNFGNAKKWVLLANDYDDLQLRNCLAFYLMELLDMEYKNRGEYVELFVDDDYAGLYFLTHKVEISTGSVNIKDRLGVLVELDNLHYRDENYFTTDNGNHLVFKDFVSEEDSKEATDAFLSSFNEMERLAKTGNYSELEKVIDVESFAKYFLISEFSENPDAFSTSFFFFKNGDHDKIHAGPAWDFDFAFGNERWNKVVEPNSFMTALNNWKVNNNVSGFFADLMDIPEFSHLVQKIFNEKLAGKETFLNDFLLEKYDYIKDAVEKNNKKFPRKDTSRDFEYLVDWVSKRSDYLEVIFRPED